MRDASSSISGNSTVGFEDDPPSPSGGLYIGRRTTLVCVTCGPGGNVYGNTPDDCYLEAP